MTTPKSSANKPALSSTAITSNVVPLSSKETSVTPRQRPKAYQLTPVSNNQFTIGLPPSPSPRNVLSSPIPAKTPDNFNAQFEVDFNNIDQHQPAPVISQVNMAPATNVFKQPQPPPAQQQNHDTAKFENLFKSSFPDPFEQDDEIVQIQTNYEQPQIINQQQQHLQQQQLFDNTNDSQQQVTAKINQHRRYMSDTSGFKRYKKIVLFQIVSRTVINHLWNCLLFIEIILTTSSKLDIPYQVVI